MAFTTDTAITPPKPEVGTEDIADMLDGQKTDAMADAISWFWEHFVSGQSLYQDLCEPLTGDFNRIKANGAAWTHTGTMMFNIGSNMEVNARKLVSESWHGDAAQQFYASVLTMWTPAMLGAQQVCNIVGKGFEAIAQASINAAKKIITKIIPKIMHLIRQLAAKVFKAASPLGMVVEFAGMAWDAVKHGEFPGMAQVKAILSLIAQVKSLFETIKSVVAVGKTYHETATGIVDYVKNLPNLAGSNGHVSMAEAKQAIDDLKAQREQAQNAYDTYAGKPVTDKDGNQLDKDGNIVIDKDGNVVNPDGEVAREESEQDEAMDKLKEDLAKMERMRDDLRVLTRKKQ